jgi:zinc/manganese transport system permease protein
MDTLTFLLAPFVASLILTGIHAYLGVHVVERGVVFVDLSLAQIAALGTTIAVLSGYDPHGRGAYWFSLAFTFLGAAVFSTIKSHKARIPQEAVIGISYAVASAAAILIYGVIGVFHYIFRKKFLLISLDPEKAQAQGLSIRFWDFLFYASFGFVVTSSVAIAGVLLVFCYLIVPSVGAMLYAQRIGPRLAIGWTMGTLVSALGVYLSLKIDLPTGAAIVCTFGIVLVLMAACRVLLRWRSIM